MKSYMKNLEKVVPPTIGFQMLLAIPFPSPTLQEIDALMEGYLIFESLLLEPQKPRQAISPMAPLCTLPSPYLTVTSNMATQIPPVKEPEYSPQLFPLFPGAL